jgi:hypothetical protein
VLKIELSGASAPLGSDGFDVEADPTIIRGLVINGFKSDGSGNSGQAIGFFNLAVNTNNVVEGTIIGTNAAGAAVDPGDVDPNKCPNDEDGVISNSPARTGNVIGAATPLRATS